MYKQLTLEQRYTIFTMRQNGYTLQSIADELTRIETEAAQELGLPIPAPRSASTISRELNRNRTKTGKYNPKTADLYARDRKIYCSQNSRTDPSVVKKAISLLVKERWSPEQISGSLAKDGIRISKERIYQEIRRNMDTLSQYCHHKMKHRHHSEKKAKTAGKSLIPNRVSIHERPPEANGKRFGDWEMDLIVGKDNKSAVLTVSERSRSFLLQSKLASKSPDEVEAAVKRLLLPFKKHVHTITTDNGMEFRNHEAIAKYLDCKVYFADPYCSGQKGAIENQNKLLREFFPKGTDFRQVDQKDLDRASRMINRRPRKKLGFSTPLVEFFKALS